MIAVSNIPRSINPFDSEMKCVQVDESNQALALDVGDDDLV